MGVPGKAEASDWKAALGPMLLGAVAFLQTVRFPFVNWDDPLHITDNPLVAHPLAQGLGELLRTRALGYPVPVLVLSFALDKALFGLLSPAVCHAENVLFHVANVAMVFALARRLGCSSAIARGAAAIFAVHPLVAEPVCWATGRKDLLATALALGAVLVVSRRSSVARWGLSCVLCALAILAKPSAVAVPLLVGSVLHARNAARTTRSSLGIGALTAIAGALAILGVHGQSEVGALVTRTTAGALSDVTGALALQLWHLVVPVDLLAGYFRAPGDPSNVAKVLAVVAVLALGVVVWWKTPPRSPERIGLFMAVAAYLPASNVLPGIRWVADSYMYLPLVGISIATAAAAARVWPKALARVGPVAAGLAVAGLALLAVVQSLTWASSAALWRPVVARYPAQPQAWARLGWALEADGNREEANRLFVTLADQFPAYDEALDDQVLAFRAAGDEKRARETLERGIRASDLGCVRIYWMGWIRTDSLPQADERELVATAFDHGFVAMKGGLHDAASFRRVAAVLRAVGLDDRAALAEGHAAELSANGGT